MAKRKRNKHDGSSARNRNHPSASSPSRVAEEEPPSLPVVKFGEFKLTSVSGPTVANTDGDDGKAGAWEPAPKRAKKAKVKDSRGRNYPTMTVSPRLKHIVKINDLQNLVLWLIADGIAPQWLMVKNKPDIRRVVVLMVPGLSMDMFDGTLDLHPPSIPVPITVEDEDMGVPISRDSDGESLEEGEEYEAPTPEAPTPEAPTSAEPEPEKFWPHELKAQKLPPCLQEFPTMFTHAWPIKTAGDDKNAHIQSPVTTFLNSPIPKGGLPEGHTPNKPKRKRIGVSSVLMTIDQLIEDEYPLHSTQLARQREIKGLQESEEEKEEIDRRKAQGWKETDLTYGNGLDKDESGTVTEGKTIYAIDCEMCKTEDGFELTRISILNWCGEVIYDTLVKPTKPITDYLTQYSGMTAEKLDPVTTTLADVQSHLTTLFNADTILLGQSLVSDLTAMKFAHPYIVDTSVLYHHTRGPPYKPSLKWLSQRYLKREIQTGGGAGHDSIEDARACLDLLKLKLENGHEFGTSTIQTECIFKRLARHPIAPRLGAVVDSGTLEKKYGSRAAKMVNATTDSEVVAGVISCARTEPGAPGMDFTWGRLRGLEAVRGWSWDGGEEPSREQLAEAVQETARCVKEVYEGLPRCTAFIVFAGTGDLREMKRLNEMKKEFKRQYQTLKWDQLTVKWTDVEDQALKAAVRSARSGVGFMTVK